MTNKVSKIPGVVDSCKSSWRIYFILALGVATGVVLGNGICKILFY